MITVAETEPYRKRAEKLLTESERNDLIAYLSEHPAAGVIIQGTNGVRKIRWAKSGGGKSGGFHIVYYFHSGIMPLYLLAIFGKNEKANITDREKRVLAKITQQIVDYWRKRNG